MMDELVDKGHKKLLADLKSLMRMAENFEFHDFKNTEFATPKIELRSILLTMAERVVEGEYDN